jgi:starch phosphorylase
MLTQSSKSAVNNGSTSGGPSAETIALGFDEIRHIAGSSGSPDEVLAQIVHKIADRFQTDVCSVYLLEPSRAHLILAATVGLSAAAVGKLRMTLGEGLAGLVCESVQPVVVEDVSRHPRFKYFPEAEEDAYQTFVGVPLVDRGILQGVLVVQTIGTRHFATHEVELLAKMGAQLGPVVSRARAMEQFIIPAHDRLWALARNLWWSWDEESVSLFRDLDEVLWRKVDHNPITLLSGISLTEMEERAGQRVLHSRINYAYRRLQDYLNAGDTWGNTHANLLKAQPVAYFSAEFGIHESMPIYSGGLGILAGDHIKSASDLGVPLVAIGLFYNQGYFHQRLDRHGWQHEEYIANETSNLPLELALTPDNQPLIIAVETRGGSILARVWLARVGRVKLLLLDSNVEGNQREDRELTSRLYGGDNRSRIRQELLLGVGGVRALKALNIHPGVLHLNEGHSAFAVLETIRQAMHHDGKSFDAAAREISAKTVFTTHTPVPAGHDRFGGDMIEEHLGPLREALGLSHDGLMALGRVWPHDQGESFTMTVLALKLSRTANGVSALHGVVSRNMWKSLWPNREEHRVPIGHITNGVHVATWVAPQMKELYDRQIGPSWITKSGESETWKLIDKIDNGQLWETHLALKARLLDFVRRRAVLQSKRRGEGGELIDSLASALSPDALTIGFARRFATYKRANLAFFNAERIVKLINDVQRPVQFVFAGKAHPRDNPGKEVLRQIANLCREPHLLGKVVFVEDYDMNVARHLVQGVDVWLNNPRRPLEASGTSGEKVVLNGVLNLSILDGWWAEAYDSTNGFAIGRGQAHVNTEIQDQRDADSLYETLVKEVIPEYYERDSDGLPHRWIARLKRGIQTLGWRFNADRMVMDYTMHCYLPAASGCSSAMVR